MTVPVSARQRTGLDTLLEMILLVAELRDLRATPDKPARATVIEARLDKGRGPVATVLVQDGTLRPGDAVVVGETYGRIRAMHSDAGERVEDAVEVGRDVHAEYLDVVAHVPDHGHLGRVGHAHEPAQEARAADAAGEGYDPHRDRTLPAQLGTESIR